MNRPAVLLADEPTGALDSRAGEQVMDLLLDLNQIGQTLLLVTHDQQLATRCASRRDRLRRRQGRARAHPGAGAVSAVWRVARAAVRRRRLQTVVIGVVVLLSTTMIVVALGLLAASAGPFDQAYARQSGAHLVASFDRAKVTDGQLQRRRGVRRRWPGRSARPC